MFTPDAVLNEIFAEIFALLPKTDLVSVSLTCNRFQAIAEPFQYHHPNLSTHADTHSIPLESFLRGILARPILANYVRSLDIHWYGKIGRAPQNVRDITLFTAAAKNAGIQKPPNSPGAQIALLLYLLPNMRSLTLFPPLEYGTFDEFLEEIVVPATAALSVGLKSLRDITYHYSSIVTTPKSLHAILALPSIRKITVLGMGDTAQFDFSLNAHSGKSSVTELSFMHCRIPNTLGSLQDYPALRSVWCPLSVLLGRWPRRVTSRLVQVLPAVIEELRIGNQVMNDYCEYLDVVDQVMEVLEQKRVGRFKRLVMITMKPLVTMMEGDTAESEHSRLVAMCDSAGVAMIFNKSAPV